MCCRVYTGCRYDAVVTQPSGRRSATASSCAATPSSTRTSSPSWAATRRSSSTRDPRSSQAREILDDLRDLGSPAGRDRRQHARPLRPRLRQRGLPAGGDLGPRAVRDDDPPHRRGAARRSRPSAVPDLAAELADVVLDPPDRTFTERARRSTSTGERSSSPTSVADIPTTTSWSAIPDADVLCAGDLVENGAPPRSATGIRWTGRRRAEALLALVGERTVVVPGHGAHADRAFVERRSQRSAPSRTSR